MSQVKSVVVVVVVVAVDLRHSSLKQ